MNARSQRAAAIAGAVLLGWLVAFSAPRDFTVGTYVDDAHYAVLAKALRERGQYRAINLPDSLPETKFPPAFPAVLSLVWSPERTDEANLDATRLVNLVLIGPLGGALAALGMQVFGLSPLVSILAALAGLLAPHTAQLWTVPLSEPLFLLVLTASLLFLARGRGMVGILLLVAATYVRTIALAFLVGALIVRWRRKAPHVARETALASAGLAPWILWLLINRDAVPAALWGSYGPYSRWYLSSLMADWVTVLLRVPLQNIWVTGAELGGRVLGHHWLPVGVLVAAGVAVLWSAWHGSRRHGMLLAGLGLYAVAVVMWPFPPERLISGLWPLVLMPVVAAWGRRAPAVAAVLLVVGGVGFARGHAVEIHRLRGEWFGTLVAQVRPLVPDSAVIASNNPPLHYLALGTRTVPNVRMRYYRAYRSGHWSTGYWGLADDLWAIMRRYRPGFVLLERRGAEGRYGVEALASECPSLLQPVWQGSDAELLFRVDPAVACNPRPREERE